MAPTQMFVATVCIALVAQTSSSFLKETFGGDWEDRWVLSTASKDGADDGIAKYNGKWAIEDSGKENTALVASEANRHYAVSSKLSEPFAFEGKPLVIQYDVTYKTPVGCGGSYLKLLSAGETDDVDLAKVVDKTPYTILFGPDKCGMDAHLRFIFRHKSPVTGDFREVHARKIADANVLLFSDAATPKSHLVTLVINPDNTFSIKVDTKPVLSGRLGSEDEFDPALSPAKEIDDPSDKKPADWVDEKMIANPEDVKPADWDQPKEKVDPKAVQPEEWDEEEDGEWEAPTLANPEYKGEWKAKQIDNPEYKGVWSPKQLENPEYFEDTNPYKMTPIVAATYELWTTTSGFTFDNLIITDDEKEAEDFAAETWQVKRALQDKEDPNKGIFAVIKEQVQEKPWLVVVMALLLLVPLYLVFSSDSAPAAKAEKDGEAEPAEPAEKVEEKVEDADKEGSDADAEGDKKD